MTILSKIRNTLGDWKVYVNRSGTYISLVNMGMILFLFLSNLKDKGYISFKISEYIVPIFIGSFILWIVFGWFDMKYLKMFKREVDKTNEFTPLHPKLEQVYQKIINGETK